MTFCLSRQITMAGTPPLKVSSHAGIGRANFVRQVVQGFFRMVGPHIGTP